MHGLGARTGMRFFLLFQQMKKELNRILRKILIGLDCGRLRK